jgi:dUTPase
MNLDPKAWTDISSESVRTYIYPNGFKLSVPEPTLINISPSSQGGHSHRIQTATGEGVYVAPGWAAVTWKPKEGQPIFTF